jgi:heterogeneous nuclear ribonucleoprotein F/H
MCVLSGFSYVHESVKICRRNDGKPTGEAYIAFDPPDESVRAIEALDKRRMGSRYIELFAATSDEAARARA